MIFSGTVPLHCRVAPVIPMELPQCLMVRGPLERTNGSSQIMADNGDLTADNADSLGFNGIYPADMLPTGNFTKLWKITIFMYYR